MSKKNKKDFLLYGICGYQRVSTLDSDSEEESFKLQQRQIKKLRILEAMNRNESLKKNKTQNTNINNNPKK